MCLFQRLLYGCLAILMCFQGKAQDFSNKGTEFWLAYSYHVGMVNTFGGAPKMSVYITSDVATNFSVEIFAGPVIQSGTVSAGQVVEVDIPNTYFIDGDGKYSNRAIRVSAASPVVVYAYITARQASAATLCLPAAVLGKEYIASAYTQASNESNSNSFITIVAVEDNTTVEIIPSANTKSGWAAGSINTITLNKGDVYQVLGTTTALVNGLSTGSDLTGSRIRSIDNGSGGCKNIAVFSGSGKLMNQCGSLSGDNLYQQLYPLVTWGLKYLTVPSVNRPVNIYRVIRTDAATNVYVNGAAVPAGSFVNNYYEFRNDRPNVIEADKPISVIQYFTTQGCDGNPPPSDPDMIILNPVEQNIDKVTLINSNLAETLNQEHNIHVIMKNSGTGISSFKFDGAAVPAGSWKVHPADANYSYLYLPKVSSGYHKLSSDSGFNALAYGFANLESYGYAAGANVKDLYQFMSIKNEYATVNYPAACSNSPFYFRMTFPYQPDKIEWIFGAALNAMGIANVTTTNPLFDSTYVVNGRTLYRYTLPNPYTISTTGSYPVKVMATTAAACGNIQEISYTLNVYEGPAAKFSFTGSGCVPVTLNFTDMSNTGQRPAYLWNWLVSDGRTSGLQNPQFSFTTGGTYSVSLSLVTDIGCISAPATTTVEITAAPTADFTISTATCAGSAVTFTDASPNSSGLKEWRWNFGDGAVLTRTDNQPVSHTYATAGTYTVSLSVISTTGCSSTPTVKSITIHPLPQPAFTSPGSCLSDPFTQFTDASTISDGSAAGFIYNWNFGDPNASAANPNTSAVKNPQHKYTVAGVYSVTLNLTSSNGCVASTTSQVSINGVPTAKFLVDGGPEHCSGTTIRITDQSTIDFGVLTRLEIFWDDGGDPSNKTVFANPQSGGVYTVTYPAFQSPATKSYNIKLLAYSGTTCFSSTSQTITLKAGPGIFFDPIDAVCADGAPFQVTGAGAVSGTTGSGIFGGKGISSTGFFNPAVAGPGAHTITYTFTAANGCSSSKDQTISVDPLPLVNAGADRVVVQGASIKILATAQGSNLSYNWSPATALDAPAILQPTASPVEDITYTLTVTSAAGCEASDEVLVKVIKGYNIPNVFTPNGDGINDTWILDFVDSYPGATVKVFNRYGQVVFESKGYGRPWNGTYNGNPVPAGTYYYIIDLKNNEKPLTGFVDVVR